MSAATIATDTNPAASLAAFAAALAAGGGDAWQPDAQLIALYGDPAAWAGDADHLARAAAALEAAQAAALGDERGLARAMAQLERTGPLTPPPSPVDVATFRQALAQWPDGLPMAHAWEHPALRWDAGTLSIVAAPTSAGKTTFLLAQVLDWLQGRVGGDGRLLIWTCETPAPLVVARLVGMVAGESLNAVMAQERQGLLTPAVAQAWQDLAPVLPRLTILDDDTSALDLVATATALAVEPDGLTAVLIDYLQELPMVPPDHPDADRYTRSREAEVGMVARTLRRLAGALRVPVIAAAQFNRTISRDNAYVPDLLQLRESGRIEQNAGLVIGLRNEAMSQTSAPPSKAPSGWVHTPTSDRSYSSFVPTDALVAARLGAQIAVRDMYGSDHILEEAFILKNRWRGAVGTVVPFALHPVSGRMGYLPTRYAQPSGVIPTSAGSGRRRTSGGAGTGTALAVVRPDAPPTDDWVDGPDTAGRGYPADWDVEGENDDTE